MQEQGRKERKHMNTDNAFAMSAVQRIAEIWQVDKARSEWSADGFDWWPGDHRVRVRAEPAPDQKTPYTLRLLVRTDFLKEAPVTKERFILLAPEISLFAAQPYGLVYVPASTSEEFSTLWFSSSAYLNSEMIGWLPDFLARLSIMQPINARIQAQPTTEILGGVPDVSRPHALKDAGPDEMLEVAAQVYAPQGERPSRWAGTDEFENFANKWGNSDSCFGFGDPKGLTVETPFGNDSALVRLRTEEKHPQLGHGLSATLQLPYFRDAITIAKECAALNLLEVVSWTSFPQLGCWHPHRGRSNQEGLAFSSFIPNALYQPGIATNLALWLLGRARWARELRWPEVTDQTMAEILKSRLGGGGLEGVS
jgi:hypothetical protein